MALTNFKLVAFAIVVPWILAGCGIDPNKTVEEELTGTEEQRVAKLQGYLLENAASEWTEEDRNGSRITYRGARKKAGVVLPGKIMNPHFLYTSTDPFRHDGDVYFISFRVPLEDVGRWVAFLESEELHKVESLEKPNRDWWVPDEQLSRLTFYRPLKLSGKVCGWAGVDNSTGEIFVYSFTM